MAEYLIQDTTLTNLGDKIRVLSGSEDTMTPAVMADELDAVAGKAIMLNGGDMVQAKMPKEADWYSIAYGNGMYVAATYDYMEPENTLAYSVDGILWNETSLPSANWWTGIAFGNGKFVAVSYNSNQAAYSTDGITWISTTLPLSSSWGPITYGNGKFVVISRQQKNKVIYSEDGVNWQSSDLPSNSKYWYSVAYGDGKFVALSGTRSAPYCAYSEDCVTWVASQMPSIPDSASWKSITYGNGKFVAISYNSDVAAYSSDGITWTTSQLPVSVYWETVTYGNNRYVAFSPSNIAYSDDGINWTGVPISYNCTWSAVAYGDKFVAIDFGTDTALLSNNGATWDSTVVIPYYLTKCDNTDVTEETIDTVIGDEIDAQADLISQITEALGGKAISSGDSTSTPASFNDVNFRDYDGTILYSYSADEALALTAMPDLPSQAGLTCQGWNWSLENMQSYVGKYGKCEIGATYITDDGKTRVYITLQEGRTSPMLGVCPNGTVTVDWGDGTTPDTLTGTSTSTVAWTPTHNYASAGDYVITLTVDGEMGFYGSSASNTYAGILRYSSAADSRNRCYQNAVQKVEIGDGVTSIDIYAFCYCCSLASITIPDGVTSIGERAFGYCYSLASITIHDGVTSIGRYTFYNCNSLASITIPDGVTSIVERAFYYCYSLASIIIPDSVTSIGDYAFYYCYSLASITIPDGVTSIGSYVFYNCNGLAKIRFNSTNPPTVSSSNAFEGIPTDCVISVPTGTLSAYTSATNYPSSSTYTYIEED